MGVKSKLFSFFFVLLTFFVAANLPRWIILSVPTAEVIMPVSISHTPTINCKGTLEAKNKKETYAQQPLMIEEVYVKEGDWVAKGDILAKIDIKTSEKLASINSTKTEPSKQQMGYYLELASQYGLDEEAKQYITQQTAAKEITIEANSQPLEEYIKAEESGQLLSFTPKPGQLLDFGSQIYTIHTGRNYQAVLQVNETDIPQIKPGNKVIITGEGLGKTQYNAVITAISPSAVKVFDGLAPKTIVEVTAEFFSDDVLTRPGISVQGQIAVSDAATMISVPYEAILQDENNREYVYQLIDGNITKRYIQVEQELANYVQVVSGMEETAPVFLQSDSIVDSNNYHIVYREDWYE